MSNDTKFAAEAGSTDGDAISCDDETDGTEDDLDADLLSILPGGCSCLSTKAQKRASNRGRRQG